MAEMIDLRYVKKLVDMLDGSSVDSIEISSDKGMKIRISKTPSARGAMQVAAPIQMSPMLPEQRMTPSAGIAVISDVAPPAPRTEPPKATLLEVKSPMVGTFYGTPEPGARPYVTVGSKIEKGKILCIIEAMKIMNEIESEFSGVVKEIVATEAHPVEYGQTLFRIDPNG